MNLVQRYRQWIGPALLAVPFIGVCLALESARNEKTRGFENAVVEYDRLRSVVEDIRRRREPETRVLVPDTRFHDGSDANLVAAAMLAAVKRSAAERGLGISRAETHQPTARAGLLWAGISTELTGPVAGLYGLIADIEAARPVLVIDELRIRTSGITPAFSETEPPLVATFEIAGPMNVAAPKNQ